MSELYMTGSSKVGRLRFRFEHDNVPTIALMAHVERLHFLRVSGVAANVPIAVPDIRRQDALLCVFERRILPLLEAPLGSDRFLDRTRNTVISNSNQITIDADTTSSEILVGWFAEPD